MSYLICRLGSRSLVAVILLACAVTAKAITTDCVGIAFDGRDVCRSTDSLRTTYRICTVTLHASHENAMGACRTHLCGSNPMFSEVQVNGFINCVGSGGERISRLSTGPQT